MQDDTSAIRFNPSKNGYYGDDSKTRPTGSSGSKDFSKIMSKNERDGKSGAQKKPNKSADEEIADDYAEEFGAVDEEEHAPQGPVSLFDMSKAQPKLNKPFKGKVSSDNAQPNVATNTTQQPQQKKIVKNPSHPQTNLDAPPQAPTSLTKKEQTTSEPKISEDVPVEPDHMSQLEKPLNKPDLTARPFDLLASNSREASPSPTEKLFSQKKKSSTELSREQPDQTSINPMAVSQPVNISINMDTQTNKPIVPVKSVQELINQMVKEVQSMESEGKTDTTITLKQPPLFEGAQLVITSFNSARGEFNIAFENLSAAAQQLISSQQNKESLLHALEQKGYHVHMVTASTIDEQRLFTAQVDDNPRERERNKDDENQRDRRNQDEEKS